jgi:lipopolysaccharide/colanic/teichoic acid biosynthesis glycosyltransferase|tara:strand:+ start:11684 stop:12268 length:585 start_codon:yes stop_codon:yes gene_type:complete
MKTIIDLSLSIFAIALLSPILISIGLIILFSIGRPIIFVQTRPGYDKRPFKFYKFRTMTNFVNDSGDLLPDEARLTKLGSFLRKTSLDELPSLWNVVKGDMSLVGPRPLLMDYLPHYSEQQIRRHEVKPGITGWAQINGRNLITWEQKFKLDIWYVDNQSLWLDIRIIILTVWKVITGEGVSPKGRSIMKRFDD